MPKLESLTNLRTRFAWLYDQVADIRIAAADAGLDVAQIDWQGSAVQVWQAILAEADRQNQVASLVEVACQRYPARAAQLRADYEHYVQAIQPPAAAAASSSAPASSPSHDSGGGAHVGNDVHAGRDFIGRDQINIIVQTPEEAARVRQGLPQRTPNDDPQRASWQRQLDNYRDSLRLIEERMSQYVLPTDIPLQLLREQERLLAKIAELTEKLGKR